MDTDYTINQPVIGTLQDALNLAFGKNRIQVGGCLDAQSVAEVCSLLEAAHRFNVRVHIQTCPKDSLAVDLSRLNKVRDMDTISQLVTAESGMQVGELETALADEGLTLGPSAFADPRETLGSALARGDGAALVASVGAVLADGTLFHTPLAPRRATGPNPDALLVGTGSRIAFTVWVTLRVQAVNNQLKHSSWRAKGVPLLNSCRILLRNGMRPTHLRIQKGAKGMATATWSFPQSEYPRELDEAMEEMGAKSVEASSKAPPVVAPRRLRWSELEALLSGSGRVGLWIGPMDLHGGWTRIPGKRKRTDRILDRVVAHADPLSTLPGDA